MIYDIILCNTLEIALYVCNVVHVQYVLCVVHVYMCTTYLLLPPTTPPSFAWSLD